MPSCHICLVEVDRRAHYCTQCGTALLFSNYCFEKLEWATAVPEFQEDKLLIFGHHVMQSWETPYMESLARIATRRGGAVLELGFGMGISAAYIQEAAREDWVGHAVTRHIIIEANEGVFARAVAFASAHPTVTALLGLWQTEMPLLEDASFDGVLFDTYPLSEEEAWPDDEQKFPYFEEAYRVLRPGGVFTYYSSAADALPEEQRAKLIAVGFSVVKERRCAVTPPKDCVYWEQDNFVCPIAIK